jgi:hypothetical protein
MQLSAAPSAVRVNGRMEVWKVLELATTTRWSFIQLQVELQFLASQCSPKWSHSILQESDQNKIIYKNLISTNLKVC